MAHTDLKSLVRDVETAIQPIPRILADGPSPDRHPALAGGRCRLRSAVIPEPARARAAERAGSIEVGCAAPNSRDPSCRSPGRIP